MKRKENRKIELKPKSRKICREIHTSKLYKRITKETLKLLTLL